ncbi:MAG: leucine-rich repeat domain-containing protein [Muribaculaceae bacterium]|nr:leucine-rich repeat domain-containing protein [Muribaculaceae bacterium]
MRKAIITLIGLLLTFLPGICREFEYTYEDQTLTYTVISEEEKTVSVSAEENTIPVVVVPSEVSDGDTQYTVTAVAPWGFYGSSYLRAITLPSSLKEIGASAFYACPSLTGVNLPSSLEVIGSGAFLECSSLTDIALPSSLKELGASAFSNSGLGSIEIPGDVREIKPKTFYHCSRLYHVVLNDSLQKIGDDAFVGCGQGHSHGGWFWLNPVHVNFPETLTEIGDGAFASSGIMNADLPASLLRIGKHAFEYCDSLHYVSIPPLIDKIEDYTFKCCALDSVTLPAGLREIGNNAFAGCGLLQNVRLPSSLGAIGESGFASCGFQNIQLPPSLRTIGKKAFWHNPLDSIIIPDSVRVIGAGAFSCPQVKFIHLPLAVDTIGEGAFNCRWNEDTWENYLPKINKVIYLASQPVEAPESIFTFEDYVRIELYASEEGFERMDNVSPWNKFRKRMIYAETSSNGSIFQDISTDIDIENPYEVYDLLGTKRGRSITALPTGVYILRQGNRTKKIHVN